MECSLCGKEINSLSAAREWPVDPTLPLLVHKACIDGAVATMNRSLDPKPEPVKKSSDNVASVHDSKPEPMRKSQVHMALENELANNPRDYAIGDAIEVNGEYFLVGWDSRKVPVPYEPNDGYMHKARRLHGISEDQAVMRKHARSPEELEARKR